jgi:SAM-dependent methyltransferase
MAPVPDEAECPGCGRTVVAPGGGLDLLDDEARHVADRFASSYAALRKREGWIGPDGHEDPDRGDPRLWRARLEAMPQVVAALAGLRSGGGRPVVLDVGSGGGWAARFLDGADVIAIDLLSVDAGGMGLQVRADMRGLPVRDHTVDCVLYIASLHYAPMDDAIREAARVLRPGGMLVALDSPIYSDRSAQSRASARSAAYYAGTGFPELAEHYHPIDVAALRGALAAQGLGVIRLDGGTSADRWWQRLSRRRRPSFLLARPKPG